MSLSEAVDLVLYAFENARQGDIFVQKSPASTIFNLAKAVKEIFNVDNEIKIIGTRHGEKLYETLLTREEMAKSEDLGNYYRILPDDRDLNYGKYFTEGEEHIATFEDYHSHNTEQLDVEQIKQKLLNLDFIQQELLNYK
jgi:UDP-glucose 4-epimerase